MLSPQCIISQPDMILDLDTLVNPERPDAFPGDALQLDRHNANSALTHALTTTP